MAAAGELPILPHYEDLAEKGKRRIRAPRGSPRSSAAADDPDRVRSVLQDIVDEDLRFGRVPRAADIERAAFVRLGRRVSRLEVRRFLEQHPVFMFNLRQQRAPRRSGRDRVIVTETLGYLHADLAFFQRSPHYETPVSYRHGGVLVARDILSRYVYVVPLIRDRSAKSLLRALELLLARHRLAGHTHPVRGVAFDREPSVMSALVQNFFRANHIKFTAFKMSASKAKVAENAIRELREVMAVLERKYQRQRLARPRRWWQLLDEAAWALNEREIRVENRGTGFRPNDVGEETLGKFLAKVYEASPGKYFGQFDVDPRHVTFAFPVGAFVRAKDIVVSSAVIGNKRSETNLTRQVYVVERQLAIVSRRLSVEKQYLCRDLESDETQVYAEADLVLTDPSSLSYDRHVVLADLSAVPEAQSFAPPIKEWKEEQQREEGEETAEEPLVERRVLRPRKPRV